MSDQIEFSSFYRLLNSIKEGDSEKISLLDTKISEFKNGTKAIVDGHQRLGLAKRLSAQGKKIELLAHTFREVDGVLPSPPPSPSA